MLQTTTGATLKTEVSKMKTSNFIEATTTLTRDHDGGLAHVFVVSTATGYTVYAVFSSREFETHVRHYGNHQYHEQAFTEYDAAIAKIVASGFEI
jgi:hypothetical protein